MAEGEKLIASNVSAKRDYIYHEIVEAGIVLTGTEIKSLRNQTPNIKDAFVEVTGKRGTALEAWLVNAHIAPYAHGNIWNHDPLRRRKLLLHKRQIERIFGATTQEGMTIIPTRMYFKEGRAKIELALAKGKKKGDKRDEEKKQGAQREMRNAMRKSKKGD